MPHDLKRSQHSSVSTSALYAFSAFYELVLSRFHVQHSCTRPLDALCALSLEYLSHLQVVWQLHSSYHPSPSLHHTPYIWWFHLDLFTYLYFGQLLLIDIQGCIWWVSSLISKNRPLWHCLFSLSYFGCYIVPESCFYRKDPSSFSYCFHSPVVPFHYFISPLPVSCSIVFSYSPHFKHCLKCGKQCHSLLLSPLLGLAQKKNLFSSFVIRTTVSVCNSLHIGSYPGPQLIIDKYALL